MRLLAPTNAVLSCYTALQLLPCSAQELVHKIDLLLPFFLTKREDANVIAERLYISVLWRLISSLSKLLGEKGRPKGEEFSVLSSVDLLK